VHFAKKLRSRVLVTAVVTGFGVSGAGAQGLPPRPHLDAGRDSNSAAAYYDYGMSLLKSDPVKAEQAMIWATRLDPAHADAWYGRWVAHVLSLPAAALESYLDVTTKKSPGQDSARRAIDALRVKAEGLNPLLREASDRLFIERWIRDQMPPGVDVTDVNLDTFGRPDLGGWLAMSDGDFRVAERDYEAAIKEYPHAYGLHFDRARAFVLQLALDSALREVRIYRDSARNGNETKRWWYIRTNEMTDYTIGRLEELKGNLPAARQEYDTALIENLGFVPAHVALARLAVAGYDTAEALREYEAAAQVPDPPICYLYGILLWAHHQGADAVLQFRRAIAADSDYVPPYLPLAILEEGGGEDSVAALLYRRFIGGSPKTFAPQVAIAQHRLDALLARGPRHR